MLKYKSEINGNSGALGFYWTNFRSRIPLKATKALGGTVDSVSLFWKAKVHSFGMW